MTNIKIGNRVAGMKEYIFAKLARDVAKLEAASKRSVLNFGPGTPDFPPSQQLLDQLASYIRAPKAHLYPGYNASSTFSSALISWYETRFGVTINSDMLLPLLGAKDGVSLLPLALANPEDEVLIPNPGYPGYASTSQLFNFVPVTYNLDPIHGFKLSIPELKKKITSRTAFVWVNFPSNPTGQVISLPELTMLVNFARAEGITLIYDNAYSEVTFDDYVAPSILQVPGALDCAVEIGSFSKMSSLAGYRIGWAVGNPDIIKSLAKVKSQIDSGLSLPLQQLAAYVLTHPDPQWHARMIDSYKNRRDIIARKLKSLGLSFTLPLGALYIWAKIPDSATDSVTYCEQLLKNKHVLFTPGSAFGSMGERYVRISICINIENIEEYL